MDHLYNIVWADDNIDSLMQDYESSFDKCGLRIIPFSEAVPAIKYIRENAALVDGAITDAKYSSQGEAFQEEGKSFPGLSEFIREIESLRRETGNPLPCWIFTGYGELLRQKYDENDLKGFNGLEDKKAELDKIKEWLNEIQQEIAKTKTPTFQIRQENSIFFSMCNSRYLGEASEKTLLSILSYSKENSVLPDFNMFRHILEEVMDLLVEKGFIKRDTSKASINDRIKSFEKVYGPSIPSYIIPAMRQMLCCSDLSHPDNPARKEVLEGKAPYIYETLLFSMKTILVWLKPFVDTNQSFLQTNANNDPAYDNKGTEVGRLDAQWSLKLDGRRPIHIDSKIVKNSWKQGDRLRVRIDRDSKGNEFIKEIVRLEKR